MKCAACGRCLRGTDGVVCSQCESHSHRECVRIAFDAEVPRDWLCGECQMKAPKGRDPSTPVRVAHPYAAHHENGEMSTQSQLVEQMGETGSTSVESVSDETTQNITAEFQEHELQLSLQPFKDELLSEMRRMQGGMLEELRALRAEVRDLGTELKETRVEMADFRDSLKSVCVRVDGLEQRLKAVEQERASHSAEPASQSAVITRLQNTVAHLQHELNDRDQELLMADLEIGQLPEEKGENVLHSITVLAAKLGVQLEERDVVFAERVGVAQVEGAGGEKPRARRIVVRLLRRDLRDRMLQGARVRRTLTAGDAGLAYAGPRIFVNERLSRLNRQLFHRAREECRRLQWRYTWTKRGRVFVRQADGRDAYPIRCEADIQRVFG